MRCFRRKRMIRKVTKNDLINCLEVFHRGYETVAIEFGLTEDNCPDRGRASLTFDKLLKEYEAGADMYCYELDCNIVAFLGMSYDDVKCKLEDIIVLPEYRGKGIGDELLKFCKDNAKKEGVNEIHLGMIDDNIRLKNWYKKNGFKNIELVNYDGAPFTVGYMKCVL